MSTPSYQQAVAGLFLGGAVGDALGAPTEFMTWSKIRATYGAEGLRELVPAYPQLPEDCGRGTITDDTQMTLFTAEAMLLGVDVNAPLADNARLLHAAYLRWFGTQSDADVTAVGPGWLVPSATLRQSRGPGRCCLQSLAWVLTSGAPLGTFPANDGKGCGTVMRVAPLGLLSAPAEASPEVCRKAFFELGFMAGRLTHGHPEACLASGFLVLCVHLLATAPTRDLGAFNAALDEASAYLATQVQHEGVLHLVDKARKLALTPWDGSLPAPLTALGEGWLAPEALAIAIWCVLACPNLEQALVAGANHGGDTDSTASIAGQLAGLLHGVDAIPERWHHVELRELLLAVADAVAGCGTSRV